MSGIVYALVLMGCSDAGDQCQRLDYPGVRHQTREECIAATEAALQSQVAMRADFPSVFVKCERSNPSRKRPTIALREGVRKERR